MTAEVAGQAGATATVVRSRSPLRSRDFRLLWVGEAVSALGDQFALVALPWLARLLTGSALAVGFVLAVMAIPRAVLMVVGGVYVDRHSPRTVMLASNALRLVAVTALGVALLAGAAQLWMLYAFALVFGVADAFFFPAQNAIVPALVGRAQLRQANGLVQGTMQLSVLAGPAIAGLLVAALAGGTAARGGVASGSTTGPGLALLVDAATFLVSLATLALIRGGAGRPGASEPMLDAIRTGASFVWRTPSLRFGVGLVMAVNLLIVGPFNVGLPVLAYSRLPEGAAAYGLLLSAMGGGALLGLVAGGLLPPPRPRGSGRSCLRFSPSPVAASRCWRRCRPPASPSWSPLSSGQRRATRTSP